MESGELVPALLLWCPNKQSLWTYYFVHPGRRYAMPKVERFIQTALALV